MHVSKTPRAAGPASVGFAALMKTELGLCSAGGASRGPLLSVCDRYEDGAGVQGTLTRTKTNRAAVRQPTAAKG